MRLKRPNKKGQFYIFIALLLSSLVFTMYPFTSSVIQTEYSFQSLTQNYLSEAPKVVNSAVIKKIDMFQSFEDYTLNFIDYAATKNLNFELAYILINKTDLKIVNYLNLPITVIKGSDEVELENHSSEIFNLDFDELKLQFNDKDYHYQITKEDIQLKFLIRTSEK